MKHKKLLLGAMGLILAGVAVTFFGLRNSRLIDDVSTPKVDTGQTTADSTGLVADGTPRNAIESIIKKGPTLIPNQTELEKPEIIISDQGQTIAGIEIDCRQAYRLAQISGNTGIEGTETYNVWNDFVGVIVTDSNNDISFQHVKFGHKNKAATKAHKEETEEVKRIQDVLDDADRKRTLFLVLTNLPKILFIDSDRNKHSLFPQNPLPIMLRQDERINTLLLRRLHRQLVPNLDQLFQLEQEGPIEIGSYIPSAPDRVVEKMGKGPEAKSDIFMKLEAALIEIGLSQEDAAFLVSTLHSNNLRIIANAPILDTKKYPQIIDIINETVGYEEEMENLAGILVSCCISDEDYSKIEKSGYVQTENDDVLDVLLDLSDGLLRDIGISDNGIRIAQLGRRLRKDAAHRPMLNPHSVQYNASHTVLETIKARAEEPGSNKQLTELHSLLDTELGDLLHVIGDYPVPPEWVARHEELKATESKQTLSLKPIAHDPDYLLDHPEIDPNTVFLEAGELVLTTATIER